MNNFFLIDEKITLLLNGLLPRNYFFNSLFSFFSLQGGSIIIWVLVIVVVLIIEELRHPGIQSIDKLFIIFFLMNFSLSFAASDVILKPLFHRLRPQLASFNQTQPVLTSFDCPIDFSFPSTHAATAFAAATTIAFFDKKRRWFYYLVACLISFSRIYLGCHYMLDVIAGAIFGWWISVFFLQFKNQLIRYFRRKK